jgi:hypothetical protein
MDTIKLSHYIDNYEFYHNLYPWLDRKQIKKTFGIKTDKKKYNMNGIIINEKYVLTPYMYEYGVNYSVNNVTCKLLFKSFEYKLCLFLLDEPIEHKSFNIYELKKAIPDENEKLQYKNKSYGFKPIYRNIPNKTYKNLYYIVNNIDIGVPVYQNQKLIGLSISNTEIINIFSIYNFITEIIEYNTYSGFYTLYYQFAMEDKLTKIINNYNISYNKESVVNRNNLQNNDILLEIDGYPITNNSINHELFGNIEVFTYVLLSYNKNQVIKMKISREDKILNINVNTRSIYSVEAVSTNNNSITEYRNIDGNIYYELNYWIVCNLVNMKGGIPESIKYFIMKQNINDDKDYGSRIVMEYDEKTFKERKIKLENIITIRDKKNIINIKDIE